MEIDITEPLAKVKYDTFTNQIVNCYLKKHWNTSSISMKVYRSAILRFLNFVDKKTLDQIDRMDAERYLQWLDDQHFEITYKLSQLRYLYSFFDYAKDQFESKRISFFNPIPKPKNYKFAIQEKSIQELKTKEDDKFYTINEIAGLLRKAYNADYEFYIGLVLLTFCGMRVSEMLSIKLCDIHLDERYLETGIMKNARKSNKDGNKPLCFIFPEEVANLLFVYFQYHQKKYGMNEWLFPRRNISSETHYIPVRTFEKFLASLDSDHEGRTHKFRHSIATYRAKNEYPLGVCELLSNHRINSTEASVYRNVVIEDRLKYYDKYFPNEYILLLKILQTLY